MPLTPESAFRKDQRFDLSKLQHRHYAAIAAIIACLDLDTIEQETAGMNARVAEHFALCLLRGNPRFDRARFIRACGVEKK